jgi:predicted nucleic acid-binding protein
VLDASALVRAFVGRHEDAVGWLSRIDAGEVKAMWPELIHVETASALAKYVRGGLLSVRRSRLVLAEAMAVPAVSVRLRTLVEAAFPIALDRELTVYDACYVVLAETLDAPLVTADRRLAAATGNAVLISR